jgi:hypothetical protein
MHKRIVQVTVYLVIQLFDKQDKSFLRETYTELSFPVVIKDADPSKEVRDIVPDSAIHRKLSTILDNQLLLPEMKKKYPELPDFYIGKVRLFTQQAFFEDRDPVEKKQKTHTK